MTGVTFHLNSPASIAVRRVVHCPTCQKRRRFSGFDQLWYGPTWTCLGCGDSWAGGERLPRPFRPRWRVEARRHARRRWEAAVRNSGPEHTAWLHDQLAAYETQVIEDVQLPTEVA